MSDQKDNSAKADEEYERLKQSCLNNKNYLLGELFQQ